MTLGRIIVDLLARTGSFDTDLNRSAKLADKRAREIDKAFRAAGKTIGVALAAGATAAAVALKSSIDRMDEMRDASIRLGIGVETLSAFSFAAKQTGTDIDALGKGFKLLAKNMADALNPKSGKAQIFEALGIQVADATGKLKSFEQIIPEIANKFQALEDGPTKAALALELFGKSGVELTEFLNQGGEGIQKMIDRARELGVVFGQDAADGADAFNDKLGELKAVSDAFFIQLAQELLPKLSELLDWAIEFTRDGSAAEKVAEEITSAFRGMAEMVDVAVGAFRILGNAAKGVTFDLMAFANVLQAVGKARGFDFSGALDDMEEAKQWALKGQEASRAIKDTYDSFSESSRAAKAASEAFGEFKIPGVNATTDKPFSAVGGQFPSAKVDRTALNRALGGVKDSPAKKGKSGKSDEEREAERLQSAYDNLNASLAERIALFGQEGEAVKVRYDLEHGELAKLAPAQKEQLIAQAERLDLMRAEQEEYEKSQKLAQKEAEEKLRGIEATDQLIRGMQSELEILRLTGKERERAIALRYADANATEEQKQAIADLSDAYYDAAKTADFFDEFQRGLSDTMFNVAKDFKNAGDYLWDFFEGIADYLLRAKTEQWAEQIAGIFMGSSKPTTSFMDPTTGNTVTSGGGGGIDWWGMLASFFGGGRANGGPVFDGGSYLVGERGPELFVPRTAGTVIPAAQTARMTSGGVTQNNTYVIHGPMTRQAREAARYDNARNLNRASRRNG